MGQPPGHTPRQCRRQPPRHRAQGADRLWGAYGPELVARRLFTPTRRSRSFGLATGSSPSPRSRDAALARQQGTTRGYARPGIPCATPGVPCAHSPRTERALHTLLCMHTRTLHAHMCTGTPPERALHMHRHTHTLMRALPCCSAHTRHTHTLHAHTQHTYCTHTHRAHTHCTHTHTAHTHTYCTHTLRARTQHNTHITHPAQALHTPLRCTPLHY